jgi:hypothetical protein
MMDQSVINLAQAKRQELRRLSNIYSQLVNLEEQRLKLVPQLRESVALSLINLGTRLRAQGPVSSRTLIKSRQNSWQSQ